MTVTNPLGGPLSLKIRAEDTGGRLAAFESVAAPGEGPPLHLHQQQDEVLYVLEGTLRVRLGDEVRDAPAGTFIFIPRQSVHTWQNVGWEPARILVIVAPAGLERFFERFAALPADVSPAEAFREYGPEVGMKILGPPLSESHPL